MEDVESLPEESSMQRIAKIEKIEFQIRLDGLCAGSLERCFLVLDDSQQNNKCAGHKEDAECMLDKLCLPGLWVLAGYRLLPRRRHQQSTGGLSYVDGSPC